MSWAEWLRWTVFVGLWCVSAGSNTIALAAPSDIVFTIGNFPIEARAQNAVAAKERALADGQRAALRSLFKRLVPVTAYAHLNRLRGLKADDLVEGVAVRAERNSSTEYIANYDFSFSANAVRELLQREGVPYTDEQAPPTLVIPVWRQPPPAIAAQVKGAETWTDVWKGLDLDHALTPVRLRPLTKEIPTDMMAAIVAGNSRGLENLSEEHKSELLLLAIAEPDPAAKRLTVTLAGRDATGPIWLRRTYRLDTADPAYTIELAAVVSLRIFEGRWKAARTHRGSAASGDLAAPDALQISIEFYGMAEWQEISRKLSTIPGVENFDVAGLSARAARVVLRYPAEPERLVEALADDGLNLSKVNGIWVLRKQ
jgi:Uncharacterized protein conserved in bacteria (DUF2066)